MKHLAILCTLIAPWVQLRAVDVSPASTPAVPNLTPGPNYADNARLFQGVAGIERAANGRLWATWYGGGVTEDRQNYILLSTSNDDGKTWQRVMVLDPDGDGPVRAFDPCLWHDPDGKLWLFWTQEATLPKGRDTSGFVTFAITTTDSDKADAKWSAPRQIAKGVMMNKPTVAKDGRWLLPMAAWAAEASARVIVSTDRGATFTELGAARIADRKSRNADEHMIVERKDGSLWMLVRGKFPPAQKDYTGIGESISTDGGRTWSDVTATTIPHSGTRFFIRKLASGRLLLVRQNPPGGKKDRSHLSAFLSEDGGRTWKGGLLLDERLRVSYPDGAQASDGSVYLIYDHERGGPDSAKEILMAVITEADVLAGKLVSPHSRLRVLVNKATGVKPKQPVTTQTWLLDSVDARVKVSGKTRVASGVHGKSLALDGSSVIELKESAALNAGTAGFTFSVWFNPYAPTSGQQVIAGKARYSSNERQWTLTLEPNGTLKAFIQQTGWSTISDKEPLRAGHWHLATLSVGADKAALYLNGRHVGEAALKKPVPATQAPITLGGIMDAGVLKQTFSGAVNEARFEPQVLSAEEVAASYRPVSATHELPKPLVSDTPLWDERVPLPKAADLPVLEGVEFHVLKKQRPDTDGANWTLGVGLAWHQGKLYASYGFNKGDENTETEEAHVRVSDDGGKTWGAPVVMDHGEGNLGVSHGVFLSHGDKLWAFMGAFYDSFQRTHTRAYLRDEKTGQWQAKGVVLNDGFWPMQEPQKMGDGNWIMSGARVAKGYDFSGDPPAVAISHGDDFTKWDLVVLPLDHRLRNVWGESTVIVKGSHITNISRYGGKALALISTSDDFGRTWSTMLPSNLPMATSKPYAGTLSTGQRYLVCTTTADTGGKRSPLTIAVSKPGEQVFSKVFVIRRSIFPEGPGVSHERADFSYPYAIEHDGKLYVGYTHKSHAANELAIIPVSKLRIAP
ncbi:exo-alpha-sialidase [Prosthecobacter sp.]|uniref:exo-alpha-sialidase n=1 Tax=Prosthecobacter sp. TaxID=1965333 RepID=UPI0037838A06